MFSIAIVMFLVLGVSKTYADITFRVTYKNQVSNDYSVSDSATILDVKNLIKEKYGIEVESQYLTLGNQITDGIMDSWEKRNKSYDIMSQKQSDAALGYERVYDTETNEVYKAYNGFTDDYNGERYKSITDDMYTDKVVGYIEK